MAFHSKFIHIFQKKIFDQNQSQMPNTISILGRQPDASYITTYFNDAYGGAAKPNSVLSWWPYGIWAHYNNVENSEQCAFRCYIRKVENCAFYYWGSGYCHLGNFNSYQHKLVGGYDANTKYHIRKDFGEIIPISFL